MAHACQVNQHIHPVVDKMRDAQAFADRPLVAPLSAEMERLLVKAKRIEHVMVRQPKASFFLYARAALRDDANALTEPFAPKTNQTIEGASDSRRLKETIREKRRVRAVGSYAVDEDAANVDPQQFSVHDAVLATPIAKVIRPGKTFGVLVDAGPVQCNRAAPMREKSKRSVLAPRSASRTQPFAAGRVAPVMRHGGFASMAAELER